MMRFPGREAHRGNMKCMPNSVQKPGK